MANAQMSDIENAVMDILWKNPVHTTVFKSAEALERELAEIAKMRSWASGLSVGQGRKYYFRWLDYFRDEHLQAIAERRADVRMRELMPRVPTPGQQIPPTGCAYISPEDDDVPTKTWIGRLFCWNP